MPDDNPSLVAAPPPQDAPKEKAPEGKEEPPKEPAPKKEEFDPSPDHPRFKEVIWKMRKFEREKLERDKDVEALAAHNREMQAALDEIKRAQTKAPEEPEPDPVTDPEGYKTWHRLQLHKKEKDFQEKLEQQRMANLLEIEQGLHEDYPTVAAMVEREIALDPALKKKIWSDPNPFRAAYRYGRKKMDETAAKEKEEIERQERLDAGKVEGATPPPPPEPKEEDLTDEEKRVVRNLFRDMDFKEATKKYKEQKKAMARGR